MKGSGITRVMCGVFIISALAVLSGCARYPLNMSKAEWNALPPAAQYEARKEQASLDRARSEERKAAHAAREREAEANAVAYRQELAYAPYGSRMSCLVEGEVYLLGQWQPLDSVLFELLEGRSVTVPMHSLDGRYKTEGNAEFNGYRVSFCDRQHGLSRQPEQCAVLRGSRFQYAKGVGVRFNADRFARGVIYCEYSR